jgi:pimeloyl-[acyl-carrier protein] methyl ester esterase
MSTNAASQPCSTVWPSRKRYRHELAALRAPSLWIAGRRDRLIPAAAMQWAAGQPAHGSFLEISAGHAPFLSHVDEVATAIEAFAETLAA